MGGRAKRHDLAEKVKHKIYSKYPDVSEPSPAIYTYYEKATVRSYGQKKSKNRTKRSK